MIPVRLALKDFLSYSSPEPLDFTTFHVACLSGSNGVGKSALLDAMTWAIWGCARGCEGGINQDRLIRDSADEMSVEFTFELGDETYRISRRRSRAGKAEVQFLVADGDTWKNIAAETLKETDAKIESVLRMDYKTFVASAFFLQGRSDDLLSRMKPDERKDVFARLLDLGIYERFEETAREHARDADRKRKEIAVRVESLEAALPDVASLEQELRELDASMSSIDARIAAATTDLDAARATLQSFQTAATALEGEREALGLAERALHDAETTVAQKSEQLAQVDELLGRAAEVAAAIAEIEALRIDEEAARVRQERASALDAKRAELAAVIDGERRVLSERIRKGQTRLGELEAEIGTLEAAKSQVAALDEAIAGAGEIATELDRARTLFEQQSNDGARLKEQISQLESSIAKAERNLAVLTSDDGAQCPVCGSALDAKHRTKVKKDIDKEIAASRTANDGATADLEVARKEAVRCREEIRRLEHAAEERERLTATRAGLLGRLERLVAAAAERTTLAEAVAADADLVATASFAVQARLDLLALEAELEGLYDAVAHAALRERLEALAPFTGLAGRLEEAGRSRALIAADIEGATATAQEMREETASRHAAIAELAGQVEGLDTALAAVRAGEELRDGLVQLGADAAAEHGKLTEKLSGARTGAAELEEARQAERQAAAAHRDYRRLVEAFGPAGIPKLIIDNALPELTEDANRILGRLSDHEMSITFRLERETKTGKPRETFEALVSHDGGVRDFAMFSGGEAFRVAFAVRLAMSKLLVRRSGARLETLVIDEGFGTQDPEGRERLVEAINLAREEFKKVLVITHLEELKDQFGAQIRVEKGIAGSSLAFVGS